MPAMKGIRAVNNGLLFVIVFGLTFTCLEGWAAGQNLAKNATAKASSDPFVKNGFTNGVDLA